METAEKYIKRHPEFGSNPALRACHPEFISGSQEQPNAIVDKRDAVGRRRRIINSVRRLLSKYTFSVTSLLELGILNLYSVFSFFFGGIKFFVGGDQHGIIFFIHAFFVKGNTTAYRNVHSVQVFFAGLF